MPSQKTTEPQNKQRGKPTVGSDPTSCVTPAVSPTALLRMFRNTHEDAASSEYWQVRQANCSRWVSGSSLGYNMLELYNVSVRLGYTEDETIPFTAEAEGDLFRITLLLFLASAGSRGGGHGAGGGRGVAGMQSRMMITGIPGCAAARVGAVLI